MMCETCNRTPEPDSFRSALIIVVDDANVEHLVCNEDSCKEQVFGQVKGNNVSGMKSYIGGGGVCVQRQRGDKWIIAKNPM